MSGVQCSGGAVHLKKKGGRTLSDPTPLKPLWCCAAFTSICVY